MITGFLIVALAALSLTRKDEDRYSILVFAALCGFFQFISDDISDSSGYAYYLGAAIVDLLIIILISKAVKQTATLINLQKIALWFIYTNTAGWITYELYYPPIFYDALCLVLFVAAIYVAAKKGGNRDLGSFTDNCNDFAVYRGYNTCNTQMQKNQEKI